MRANWLSGLRELAMRPAKRLGLVRFRRNEDGTTAVEFSIIAIPFAALMFAIAETGVVFFAGQTMETAVDNASRLVRTGQAQQQAFTKAKFLSTVCDSMKLVSDCTSRLMLDVRTVANFSSVSLNTPLDKDGKVDAKNFTYQPGKGGDIVVVRAYYEWPVYVKMLGFSLANTPTGARLLGSTIAFRNEPFAW